METLLVLTALILTIGIELLVAVILGYRDKTIFKTLFIINCLTNPLLNLVILLNNRFMFINSGEWFLPAMEILVVATETWLLRVMLKKPIGEMFILAIAANAVSYLSGILLFN